MSPTAWTAPRRTLDGRIETPYHHARVWLYLPGADPVAIDPLDLPPGKVADAFWAPMAWAEFGGRVEIEARAGSAHHVLTGEDGWLYGRINGAFEQMFEGSAFNMPACERWREVIAERHAWCAERGMAYRLLVVPEKHTVYADRIPGHAPPSPDRPICRIMEGLAGELRESVVYPLQAMIDGRAAEETYLRGDVHFSDYGAWIVYRALLESLPGLGASLPISSLRRRNFPMAGDLARWAGVGVEKSVRLTPTDPADLWMPMKGTSFRAGQVDIWQRRVFDGPSLCLFRTSNSSRLIPFLVHHVRRLVGVAETRVLRDLVESECPDYVINEIPERYLLSKAPPWTGVMRIVPEDAMAPPCAEVTGCTLPLPG